MTNNYADWQRREVILKALGKSVTGNLKYGIREPIKPGTVPLRTLDTRENGGRYYFTSDNDALKIKLLLRIPFRDRIIGLASDFGRIFGYTLEKKKGEQAR